MQQIINKQSGNCCFAGSTFPCHGNNFGHFFLSKVKF
jgi:hypothetical protein